MKVLHICNDYYYTSIYRNLHLNLTLRGLDSIMLVPTDNNDIQRDKEKNVIQAKCFNKIDRFFYFRKQKKILDAVKKQTYKEVPNVLHAHFLFTCGYSCLKIKQEYGIPYIVAIRNTDVNIFFKYMIHLRPIGIQIMMNAEKVVFISSSYRDLVLDKYVPLKFKELFMKKSVVLPNGIDDFWLNNLPIEKKSNHERKINLLTVGAINQNKNQLAVMKAAQLLNNRGYQVKYTVVGANEDEKIYDELSKHDFVKCIEKQPKEKLIHYYREADIFVMPSIHETFGLVYAEAMTQGLPVIYTRDQGFDGQFEEGIVGYSVQHDSPKEISRKIEMIRDNYKLLSKKCIENVERFDWDKIGQEYIDIYQEILQ